MEENFCENGSVFDLSAENGPLPIWAAKQLLKSRLEKFQKDSLSFNAASSKKNFLRFQVQIFGTCQILFWLRKQRSFPKLYFRTLDRRLELGGLGAAHSYVGPGELSSFQPEDVPSWAYYIGGERFDPESTTTEEWEDFSGHFFHMPLIELRKCDVDRSSDKIQPTCVLAVNLHWGSVPGKDVASCITSALHHLRYAGVVGETPTALAMPSFVSVKDSTDFAAWEESFRAAMSTFQKGELTKLVLARFQDFEFTSKVDPAVLLAHFQSHHGYLFCLEPNAEKAFLGCTPEQLFKVEGAVVSADCIAGTRPRGAHPDEDSTLEQELFTSSKDQVENNVVAAHIHEVLAKHGTNVIAHPPFILKLAHVQHLARKIEARVEYCDDKEFSSPLTLGINLLRKLNPTPAVCGNPQKKAKDAIRQLEKMDRGLYAGPIGIISATSCEFGVALRSALVYSSNVRVFAGGGLVPGSDALKEWEEHQVKMKNYSVLFHPTLPHLQTLPNLNTLWGTLIVEELYRLGVDHFCVCPGSRSTPLTAAVARHRGVSSIVCHDERGAAFYAVGYARACHKPCAVIVTSGTAVANLLPGVVEASQEFLPMLLLTADRPSELRDTGANQTIMQPGIFGPYCRFLRDFCCPDDRVPATSLLSDLDFSVSQACNPFKPGPVQLNFMFRENLAPDSGPVRDSLYLSSDWSKDCISDVRFFRWEASGKPFTTHHHAPPCLLCGEALDLLHAAILGSKRGMLVIGTLQTMAEKESLAYFALKLQWPVLADISSGLRRFPGLPLVSMYDQLLTEEIIVKGLHPDVILYVGGRLISKRLEQFIKSTAANQTIHVGSHLCRYDPNNTATTQVLCDLAHFAEGVLIGLPLEKLQPSDLLSLCTLSDLAENALSKWLEPSEVLSEPQLAFILSQLVDGNSGFFITNSMPIRDMEMYTASQGNSLLLNVGTNRGASGIDGIVSTAIGYAQGLKSPVTLLVGDMAFIHDINALHLLRLTKYPVTIVIVNNSGSGIFSFLPIAKHSDIFKGFYDTEHALHFNEICRGFGVDCRITSSPKEFREMYAAALLHGKHSAIEVVVGNESNLAVHQQIAEEIKVSVKGSICDSIRLTWSESGRNNKFPLLFLHGFMGRKRDWKDVIAPLQDHYYCIAVDLPGHGDSMVLPSGHGQLGRLGYLQYTMEATALSILRLLAKLSIKRCGVVGYSMGGRFGMFLANKYPDIFLLAVIISANPGLRLLSERNNRRESEKRIVDGFLNMKSSEDHLQFLKKKWYCLPIWGPNLTNMPSFESQCKSKTEAHPESLASSLMGMTVADQPSFWDWLVMARPSKVVFIAGALDPVYSKFAKELETAIDSAKPNTRENRNTRKEDELPALSVRYCNTGHGCLSERPTDVAGVMLELLTKNNWLEKCDLPSLGPSTVCSERVVIEKVTLHPIELELTRPIPLKHGEIHSRAGIVVLVHSRCGNVGVGEVVPLPGFHKETLDECQQQLNYFKGAVKGREVPSRLASLDGSFCKWLLLHKPAPLVKAAIEMAILHLLSECLGVSLPELYDQQRCLGRQSHIKLNGLATMEMTLVHSMLEYSVLKVKVGSDTIESEVCKLNGLMKLMSELNLKLKLRLDANQAWTLEQAVSFAKGLSNLDMIEYIEEPLQIPQELPEFYRQTNMPYALDESISDGVLTLASIKELQGLQAIVMKPAMLGGFEPCASIISEIKASSKGQGKEIQLVITSAFESSISLCHMALFASVFCEENVCHGLSTFDRLKADVIQGGIRMAFSHGTIDIEMCSKLLHTIAKRF